MSKNDEYVILTDAYIQFISEKAVCLILDDEKIWIPKSQMLNPDEVEDRYQQGEDKQNIIMKEWIANTKGIDGYCEPYEPEAYDGSDN